ncbi:hypothetical protein AQJ11_39220, partial [Streptomyces corchorusii]
MIDSYGLNVGEFSAVMQEYEKVKAELMAAVKKTQELLNAPPAKWDNDPVSQKFTGAYKKNVTQLIEAAEAVADSADDIAGTARGTAAQNEATEEANA